jgi:ATP-dependent Clp protease protease subunit
MPFITASRWCVPQVAYRVPGAQSADWVDLYNRLYRERIVFLGQQVDDEIANQMIGVMLYLDQEDNTKPVYMYINSPGGSVTAGFAMFDTMRHIKSDVSTINVRAARTSAMRAFLERRSVSRLRWAPSSCVVVPRASGSRCRTHVS